MIFGKDRVHTDADLGNLHHRRGAWRGEIRLADAAPIPLAIPGGRSGPDSNALELSRRIAVDFASARSAIEAALANEYPDSQGTTALVPSFVQIETIDRRLMIEFGYRLPGDDDHTIGARVENGSLFELNGSIVER